MLSGIPFIAVWCNGSTTDFGSVCGGSNPLTATINTLLVQWTVHESSKLRI